MIIISVIIVLYILIIAHFNYWNPELRWNWKNIDLTTMRFPNSFFWGTATASHQVEGKSKNNNWFLWENNLDENNQPRIKDNQIAGIACDHWNKYKEDIKLIKKLGVTHYRLSLEWSKIEPEKNKFNEDAISHYSNFIDALINEKITPVITLHHFTNPIWFENIGAFENEENIKHFITFSKKVFSLFSSRVNMWCTINEPEVYSVMGYFAGIFPPGK